MELHDGTTLWNEAAGKPAGTMSPGAGKSQRGRWNKGFPQPSASRESAAGAGSHLCCACDAGGAVLGPPARPRIPRPWRSILKPNIALLTLVDVLQLHRSSDMLLRKPRRWDHCPPLSRSSGRRGYPMTGEFASFATVLTGKGGNGMVIPRAGPRSGCLPFRRFDADVVTASTVQCPDPEEWATIEEVRHRLMYHRSGSNTALR